MYYKVLKDIKLALNYRYILLYRDYFFKNNTNFCYLICENINFEIREQLLLLKKLQGFCSIVKVRKKIFFSVISQNSSFKTKIKFRNFFLYNPLILKIHVNDFLNFVEAYLLLKDRILAYNKRERRFLSFSFLIYQMNYFYSFKSCVENLNFLKDNKLNLIYKNIYIIVCSLLNPLNFLFLMLNFLINLKKNADL